MAIHHRISNFIFARDSNIYCVYHFLLLFAIFNDIWLLQFLWFIFTSHVTILLETSWCISLLYSRDAIDIHFFINICEILAVLWCYFSCDLRMNQFYMALGNLDSFPDLVIMWLATTEYSSGLLQHVLAHPLHPIHNRSRNKRRNLWVGRCVSSWLPWFPSRSSVLIIYICVCIPYMSSVTGRIYIYNGSVIQYWRSCTPSSSIGLYFWGVRGSWAECHFLFSLVYQLCLALWY